MTILKKIEHFCLNLILYRQLGQYDNMGFDSVADGDKSGSTIGRTILVLATFTLLAGTSMASGLEDFASRSMPRRTGGKASSMTPPTTTAGTR